MTTATSKEWVINWESEDPYIAWGIEESWYPDSRTINTHGPFYFTHDNHKMYPIEDEI